MKIFQIILLLIPILAYSQAQNNNVITDTTTIIGIVNEDWWISKEIMITCIGTTEKMIQKGTLVVVSGVYNCPKSNSFDKKPFYKIYVNVAPDSFDNNEYFIEPEKLNLPVDNYYKQILAITSENLVIFRNNALKKSQELYKESVILYKNDVNNALKFVDNCKSKGLAVLDWSYHDESDYTEGTSAKVTIYNPTLKTIKYIWFTFVGFNAVDDKVFDNFKRSSNITVQGIGPIEPETNADYNFDYVWHTDLVETAKITLIKIQYMDSSIKTIKNPKEIMMDKKTKGLLFKEK